MKPFENDKENTKRIPVEETKIKEVTKPSHIGHRLNKDHRKF